MASTRRFMPGAESDLTMDHNADHLSVWGHGPVTAGSAELAALLAFIGEGASERDRERTLPFALIDAIRNARLGALRVEPETGSGATNRDLFGVVIQLGDADPNVAHILRNHFSFVERFVRGQRGAKHEKWRRAVAEGAIFGLAYGELDTARVGGKDANTTLTPEGDGFRLNGTKYYSTGTLYADHVLVRARLTEDLLASAIIPVTRAGVEIVDDWDGFGQRLTGSGTTILRDVRVEADEVVPDTEGHFFTQTYAGPVPQLLLTAINAGILRGILRDAAALVRRRERSFSHAASERPADDPILQVTVGQIASNAFAAEATVLAAADALDRLDLARGGADQAAFDAAAHEASLQTSKAKVIVDDLAIRSAGLLLDVGGASATKQSFNLDRHWRNARTLASHNPCGYKARAIGDHAINGTPLPANGFF
jgi:alkylation response protein AidB-like acyl-CoA dehydrogenase